MNWGTKITLSFIAFVSIIITMVVISMRQDISLVAKDYYVQEIAYQDQINRIRNNEDLGEFKTEVTYDRDKNEILLNAPGADQMNGKIYFFRPSDASLDKKYTIRIQNGKQVFLASDFERGLWRVKVNWQQGEKEFYTEKVLIL